jgi:long-chain fatty acid transport protein
VRRSLAFTLAALAMATPGAARANPWDLFGLNARGIALGGAQTATALDFTAVYTNPASLTAAPEANFGFGFNMAKPQLHLRFDKAEREIAEVAPPTANGITFGALFPLGGAGLRNRVALGLALNVPTSSLLSGQALDPAIPQWSMYQSLPRRIVAALGVGARPVDWLSLGLSVQILAGLSGRLDYELDVVAGQLSRKSVTFDIQPVAAPIAGLEVRPLPGFRVGLSYRAAIDAEIDLPVDLEVTGVADLLVTTFFRVQYTPHQLAFGASYDWSELDLTLAFDLDYALWSKAPDPSVDSRIDVSGSLFEGTGLDDAFDAPAPGRERSVRLGYRDTFTPRFGLEKRLGFLAVRGGYALRPSPAPVQSSGTNYVDGTAHAFSLGAGVRFYDPLGALEGPMTFDVAGGLHYLPDRVHTKVTRDDPVGSYAAGGAIWVFGVALSYHYAVAPARPAPAVRVQDVLHPHPPGPAEEALPEGDGE